MGISDLATDETSWVRLGNVEVDFAELDLSSFTDQCAGVGPDDVAHMSLRVLPRQQIIASVVDDHVLVVLIIPSCIRVLVFIVITIGIVVILVQSLEDYRLLRALRLLENLLSIQFVLSFCGGASVTDLLDEAHREVLPLVESDKAFVALLLGLFEAREAAEREEAALR